MGLMMSSNTMTRVAVQVCATDPILRSGLANILRTRQEVVLIDSGEDIPDGAVRLVVCDRLDENIRQMLRGLQARNHGRIVLISGDLDDTEVLDAVGSGVCAVARRSDISPDLLVRLTQAAAAGEGQLPPDLLGRLLHRVARLQRQVLAPKGISLAGMSTREIHVLRLVAQGKSTREIADAMCYSQRTVKTILHDVTNRFQLRNRAHAVAYALNEGLL
jgi:DNA-binding NarL/FixJ family response regulator